MCAVATNSLAETRLDLVQVLESGLKAGLPKRAAFRLGEPAFLVAMQWGVVLAWDVPAEQATNGVALADALRRTPAL